MTSNPKPPRQEDIDADRFAKYYSNLVNSLDGIVWEADARTFQFTFVSSQAERILGYPVERWLEAPTFWVDHLHPDDRDSAVDYCKECVRRGASHAFEYRMMHANGECVWLRDIVSVESDGDGPVTICGVMVDITERKRVEHELVEERNLLRALIDTLPDHIFIKDSSGRYVLSNAACARFKGASEPAQVVGKTAFDFYPPEFAARSAADDMQVIESGVGITNQEEWFKRPDGAEECRLISKVPLRDENSSVIGLIAVARDITDCKRADAELRRRQELIESISAASREYIFVFDRSKSEITYSNRSLVHVELGYPAQTAAAQRLDDFRAYMMGDEFEKLERCAKKWNPAGDERAQEEEYRFLHADGTYHWFLGRQTVLSRDAQGNVTQVIGTFHDVSPRKRAEAALAESENRWRSILASEPECVKLIDAESRVLEMNPAGVEMIEASSASEVIGKCILPFVMPEHQAAFLELNERVFNGEAGSLEFEIAGIKGTRRWVETHATPFRDPSGRIVALLGVTRDITERKNLADWLNQSQQMLKIVLDSIPGGVFWKDLHSRYLGCNSVFSRGFGLPAPEAVIGMTDFDFKCLSRELAEIFVQKDREAIESNRPIMGLVERATLADGSTCWLETNRIPLRDDEGKVFGVLGTWQDVTERRRLEEQLRQSQKMEAVGQLAGGIAHDFNNLLTVINGYADLMLLSLPADNPMRKRLEQIHDAGTRAAALTRQLLTFSRQSVMEMRILDLNSVVADAEKMLRRVIGEHIELEVHSSSNLGRIKADPSQMGQVLLNLALNARDAMSQGGKLTIRTESADSESLEAASEAIEPGDYVILSVSDNGRGMPADVKERIFEPFFTTKSPGAGTGLGLAVVHGIITQCGGHIAVESELGQGTTFKIFLPVVERPQNPSAPSPVHDVPLAGTETILLVEDENSVRTVLADSLRSCGYTVLPAKDGNEALEIIGRHHDAIDLVVTDVIMPGMSGTQLAKVLHQKYPTLEILFMSGYTSDAVLRHGILEGDTNFLQKPFSPNLLAAKLREIFSKR